MERRYRTPAATGEFGALEAIRAMLPGPTGPGEVWIGDDAAVLAAGDRGWLLLAADTVVAGVHADLTLTGLDDLGWKAMAACVSDIAAMGGDPVHSLVTVAGPAATDLGLLYRGLGAAAAEYGCPIVGGDLTSAAQLVVTVTVAGRCQEPPVRRDGAHPGDGIWVSGPLGASAAGLRHLRRAGPPPTEATPDVIVELIRAHARPVARVETGRRARQAGATAMIDVSDGLGADLDHVATSSGVGIRLDAVPVATGATLVEAMEGGEDFALAFCLPPAAVGGLERSFAGLTPPVRIGTCTADPTERIRDGRPFTPRGWEHPWSI